MILARERKGELIIFVEALLWSLFPVITILTYSSVGALFTAALSTFLSAIFFASILATRKKWGDLLRRTAWKDLLYATLLTGILYYLFIFLGLTYTTAGNAAIIMLLEVFFSFLILGLFLRHEPLHAHHLGGAIAMIAGALLILLPKGGGISTGDLFIVLATIVAPIGNFFSQRAKRQMSSEAIMFVRSIVSGIVLLGVALLFEQVPTLEGIRASLLFLLVNGILLLGFSKILWLEGIHLLPITKAISLASITPVFTLILAYVFLDENVTWYQVIGFLPMFVGVILLTRSPYDRSGRSA